MDKQKYLERVQNRQNTIDLQMPSGDTWKVRPISITQYAATGQLPMHLLAKLAGAEKMIAEIAESRSLGEMESQLEDLKEATEKAKETIFHAFYNSVVYPKITEIETDESITVSQIPAEDFDFFYQYVLSGGQAAQNSFRKQTVKKRKRVNKPKNNK